MITHRGFSAVLVLGVAAIVLLVAFGGYSIFERNSELTNPIATTTPEQATAEQTPKTQPVTSGNKKTYTSPAAEGKYTFQYPADWVIMGENEGTNHTSFQVLLDKLPNNGKIEAHVHMNAEKADDTRCYLGLCEKMNETGGTIVHIGENDWTHLSKPFTCYADVCPTDKEVYRITHGEWRYFGIFDSTQDAELILETLNFY